MVINMTDITGIVLVILGAACLLVRISMYNSGNPFKPNEQDNARLPQMILLLALSLMNSGAKNELSI